jgi:hypothetical protein
MLERLDVGSFCQDLLIIYFYNSIILSYISHSFLFFVVPCPICRYGIVAYKEVQTRPSDEPQTIFYACLNEECKHLWNE